MIPKQLSAIDLAFGPVSLSEFMPDNIPDDYYKQSNKWSKFISTWFYRGANSRFLKSKPGINKQAALNHIGCILASFEPAHEDKIAAYAYLLSLWFEDNIT